MSRDPGDPAPLGLNPFEAGFAQDPYPQYRRLREEAPVHHGRFGPWTLMRYDDVSRLVREPGVSVEDRNATFNPRDLVFAAAGIERADRGQRAILNLDPPDHTRIRRLVSKAFTPGRIETLVPRVQALVDQLLDDAAARGSPTIDVIADLAFPLPFLVISELLGMPKADRTQLRAWSHTLVRSLEPIATPEDVPAIVDAGLHMTEHVQAAIGWKRDHPADDLLSALVAVEEEGDVLTPEELEAQVVLLYVAGHETTVNLIGNGTLALLRHRDELERLRQAPDLIHNAIEELLRYDSPVQFTRRIPLTELEIDGNVIEPGAIVLACLGAANHDPAHFGPTADELDLRRRDAPHHVSFGGGIHHCLGAVLARTEGRIALGTLVRRFPALELATYEPAWNGRMVLRGLDALPVTID